MRVSGCGLRSTRAVALGTGFRCLNDHPKNPLRRKRPSLRLRSTAQNASDFPLAASQWEKLLSDFPNSPLTGLAQHNLGVCRVQTALAATAAKTGDGPAEFEKAIEALKNSLSSLDKSETEKLARSFLFLGFAQARLGKDLGETAVANQDKDMLEESRKWLTTSTQTLEQLQTTIPEFRGPRSSLFFPGRSVCDPGTL